MYEYSYRRLRNKVHGDIFILSNTPTYAHGWKAENETSSVHPFFLDNYDVSSRFAAFVFSFNTTKSSFFGRFSVVYITYNIQSYDSYDYEFYSFKMFSSSLPNAK